MAANDLNHAGAHFYFTDSGSKDIKVKCRVNGTASEFTMTLNVEKPTTTFTTKLGTTAFNANNTLMGLFANAASTEGIWLTGKVDIPSSWPQGKWHWVQLVTSIRTQTRLNGRVQTWNKNGQKVLDTTYPYEPKPYGAHPGITGAYATGGEQKVNDSPAASLVDNMAATADDNFVMTIMFLADGQASRYVPTQSVTWTWGGTGNLVNGIWKLTMPSQSVTPAIDTTTHPEWTDKIDSGSWIP